MKDREKNWDIKIVDYIQEKYKSIPCFADASHPSKYVMKEVGRQVAALMGISDINENIYDCEIGIPVPIIQTVYKVFNFDFVEKKQWFGKKVDLEVEDYITAYLWWYHDIAINLENKGLYKDESEENRKCNYRL